MCIFSFATNGKAMESVTHLLFQTRKHLICIETPFEASFAIIMNIGKTTMVSQWEFCQKFQCTNCSPTWTVSFRECIYFYIGMYVFKIVNVCHYILKPFLLLCQKLKIKRYPFANVKTFCHFTWIFFLHLARANSI